MVVNLNMRSDQADSINDYLVDTIASVFPYVYTAQVGNGTNTELFASLNGDPAANLMDWCAEQEVTDTGENVLVPMMQTVTNHLIRMEGGDLILTDDKAPVELLGMKVMDEIIQDELNYYREIFKTGNLNEILGMLN
jgi:hypothetical protein